MTTTDTDLASDIGGFVIEAAREDMARWGMDGFGCSVEINEGVRRILAGEDAVAVLADYIEATTNMWNDDPNCTWCGETIYMSEYSDKNVWSADINDEGMGDSLSDEGPRCSKSPDGRHDVLETSEL